MLLIGDIHITTKYTDAILETIRNFIDKNQEEKNIIFLGDYMYMFSYDRKALSELFDLFLSLWKEGKNVYILAGNHDRIGQQFVYAEGKKIADLLPQGNNVIRFITDPEIHTIEEKKILFFPFSKHIDTSLIKEVAPAKIGDGGFNKECIHLMNSTNSNERLSGQMNMLLQQYISDHENLTIIHHYYIANTKFPGQQALFDYKDIALCPDLLDNKNIQLISGHIHMPFSYKNYLCTGSVRYTSPLEQDHHKFLYVWDTKNNVIEAQQIAINPYMTLSLSVDEKVDDNTIKSQRENIDLKVKNSFIGDRSVNLSFVPYPLALTQITLLSESIGYENLASHITPDILDSVKEWNIKRKTKMSADMSFTLEIAQKNLQESLVDRKIIVKNFIMSRFGEDFDKYRTLLDELHILS